MHKTLLAALAAAALSVGAVSAAPAAAEEPLDAARQLLQAGAAQRDVADVPLALAYLRVRRPRQTSSAPDRKVSALEADSTSISGAVTGCVAIP